MEINQKQGSNRTRFVFHDDRLDYAWKSSAVSRNFSVQYTAISRDRETLVERNDWLRNVGILWIILGAILLGISIGEGEGARGWLWLLLGLGCVAVYYLRVARYTVLPSEKGNLLVIDGPDGKRIIEEVEGRRAAQFREEYDFFPEGEGPEQLRKRFKWLHREGALDDAELQQRLDAIRAAPEEPAAVDPPTGRSLH